MSKSSLHNDIEHITTKWQGKKGTLIMILHEIQNKHGYVPRDTALELADQLSIPLARIYEVITFYNYFRLTPPGKNIVSVCMGTACYLKGAPDLIEELKRVLNVEEGGTTSDGMFQLEVVRCLGCCGLAPVLTINDKVYGKVKKDDIVNIISEYTKGE